MTRTLNRVGVVIALAVGVLLVGAPAAMADQNVQITFFYDRNGNGVKDGNDDTTPPTNPPYASAGWSARVDLYKLDANERILKRNWVWVNHVTQPISQRLSPGRWVAVLGQVIQGIMDPAKVPLWIGHEDELTQTYPAWNRSIEFNVTPGGYTQNLTFGYGARTNVGVTGPLTGPSFRARMDENFNQKADPGEGDVPDGTPFKLTSVHLIGSHPNLQPQTKLTSGGIVEFDVDYYPGARMLSLAAPARAPLPFEPVTWDYNEGPLDSITYLVHQDVNDSCDPDPYDDEPVYCAFWEPWSTSNIKPAVLLAQTPITGKLFLDSNGNGVRDSGETAPPNATSLKAKFVERDGYPDSIPPNGFDWTVDPVSVGSDGSFNLGKAPKGTYLLSAGEQWRVTTGPVVVPSTGADIGSLDVGIASTYAKGRVYIDRNANRQFDTGEQSLSGVTLQTYQTVGESSVPLQTVTTDAQGKYRIRVQPNNGYFRIVGGLPDGLEDDPHHYFDTQTVGTADVEYDVRMYRTARPGGVESIVGKHVGGLNKMWWSPPEDIGDGPLTGYIIRTWDFDANAPSHNMVTMASERCFAADSSFHSRPDDGVYTTVQAANGYGVGAEWSWYVEAEPDAVDGPAPTEIDCASLFSEALPPTPTWSGVTLIDRGVKLSWKTGKPTVESGDTSQFVVEQKHVNGPWTTVATVPGTTHNLQLNGLLPRNQYAYRVTARNSAGSSQASSVQSILVQTQPVKPRNVKAAAKKRAVLVTWKAGVLTNSNSPADHFVVQRKVGANWVTVQYMPANANRLLVKGLKPKVKVKFRVVAENKVGANPSIVVSAKPKK
jgi:hypothetical protein